jgi:hypothetical protein
VGGLQLLGPLGSSKSATATCTCRCTCRINWAGLLQCLFPLQNLISSVYSGYLRCELRITITYTAIICSIISPPQSRICPGIGESLEFVLVAPGRLNVNSPIHFNRHSDRCQLHCVCLFIVVLH